MPSERYFQTAFAFGEIGLQAVIFYGNFTKYLHLNTGLPTASKERAERVKPFRPPESCIFTIALAISPNTDYNSRISQYLDFFMTNTPQNIPAPHPIEHFWQGISCIGELYVMWAKKNGINYNTLAIFHTLVNFTHCTQKQICQAWVLPKQTVSMACQKLSADGLIEYLPGENDKREKQLVLSEKGKQTAVPIITELIKIELQILNKFGNERMADFLNEFNELKHIFVQQFGEK